MNRTFDVVVTGTAMVPVERVVSILAPTADAARTIALKQVYDEKDNGEAHAWESPCFGPRSYVFPADQLADGFGTESAEGVSG